MGSIQDREDESWDRADNALEGGVGRRPALLFDLDETLVLEEASAVSAFRATAAYAATHEPRLDPETLAGAARDSARDLWRAAPTYAYCLRVGISSWEGLWCRFGADGPETRELRAWSPDYRRETWRRALDNQGVADVSLAIELGERFVEERQTCQRAFPEVSAALAKLSSAFELGVVTNGASCLQRDKLTSAGLDRYFKAIVVSEDIGTSKPDPAIFREALAQLGASEAIMVGDSIEKDIGGALSIGIEAVWMNRSGRARPEYLPETVPQVMSLEDVCNLVVGARQSPNESVAPAA